MGRLTFVAALATVAAGCGGKASSPPSLVGGSRPPPIPAVLAEKLGDAVMTRVRVARAEAIDPVRLRTCTQPARMLLGQRSIVVERTGVAGASLGFAVPAEGLYACQSIPDPVPDRDRPKGSPWCVGSYGRTVGGRLTDPRLSLCESEGGRWTAFVWVEPVKQARWVVVRDGPQREIYEVAGSLPVRVTTTSGVRPQRSAASFDVEQYAADGAKLASYVLDAVVAG
jgi:hypothetical protein